MSILRYATSLITLSVASFTTLAQTAAEHAQHHPTVAQAQSQPSMPMGAIAPKPGASNAMPSMPPMAAMDERMKAMQAMHDKMINAKTPEERNALMAEHMKTMQDGMAMMNQMGGMGRMGAGGIGGMQAGKATPGTITQRQQMMEKRMDMMQSMMQMMMDRMPAAPAK